MSKSQKLLDQVLSGRSDGNIRFDTLCGLLRTLGFDERIRGSHHIFSKTAIIEIINLQPRSDGTAKPYQVKQIRQIITKYGLGLDQ